MKKLNELDGQAVEVKRVVWVADSYPPTREVPATTFDMAFARPNPLDETYRAWGLVEETLPGKWLPVKDLPPKQ